MSLPEIFGVPLPDTFAETMSDRLSFWSFSSSRDDATLWFDAASETASRLSLALPVKYK